MKKKLEIYDVAKETIILLDYFEQTFISNISNDFLNFLKKLAQKSNINITIDKNKKLKQQDVSEECKNLITLIYHDYIADTDEKKTIEKIWDENETIYQQMLREKYNPENLFEKGKKGGKLNIEVEKYEKTLIKYKESIFIKLKNFIFKILHINK